MCTSITRIQTEPTLVTEDNRAPIHSPVATFMTPECAWLRRGVSGSLARGTRDLSSTASRLFPMVLSDIAGATFARISSLDAAISPRTMRRS